MRSMLTAVLCALMLFIAGVLVINWQLWNSARNTTVTAARESTRRIDTILEEARLATETMMPLAQESCSPDTQFALSREAALRPHLRAVALLKGDTVWCSSFTGSYSIAFQQENLSISPLTLYSGDLIAPGVPLLVMLTPASGGYVAVSISDIHLRDALLPVQNDQQLTLIVGNRLLTRQGKVLAVQSHTASPLQIRSSRYPFSTGYILPPFFSAERLLRQGGMLLIMTALLSLTAGSLLRRYLAKYTTPEENLKKAMERGEIIPYYQPVVNGRAGDIVGIEVLARWKHPRAGFIPPDAFIPVAEKSGLILPLTHYLMQKVQADLVPVVHHFPDDFHIGINITAAHVKSPQLVSECVTFLQAFGEKPVKLILEITEREPLELTPDVQTRLKKLRETGVLLALDDFGTGYCGLSYLNDAAFDIIKIDRSFVSRITTEPDSTRLVDCVIDMARKLSLSIVAEGVETPLQVDYLDTMGIQLLQGYYFYRPMPLSKLIKVVMTREAAATRGLGDSIASR